MKNSFSTRLIAASMMALSLGLAGCLTDDDDKEEPVTTSWSSADTLTVGAQANATLGTAVDLDSARVLLSAAANQVQGSIDVLFAYKDSAFMLLSPVAAKAESISVAVNYTDSLIVDVKMVKVDAAPANWEAGVAAFDAGTQVSMSAIVANDVFIVKTTMDNYVLVRIDSITGEDSTGEGSITVSMKDMAEAEEM